MTYDGVPMLSDFGEAYAIQTCEIQDCTIQDTVTALITMPYLRVEYTTNYIAPEIANYIDKKTTEIICTRQSDMWSYGMVIYVSSYQNE